MRAAGEICSHTANLELVTAFARNFSWKLTAAAHATSEAEAGFLFDRFRTIALEFLRLEVHSGGWIALPSRAPGADAAAGPEPKLADSVNEALRNAPARSASHPDRTAPDGKPFFIQLAEWFGPAVAR